MTSQFLSRPTTIGHMSTLTRREIEAAEAEATTATLRADRRFLWTWLSISTLLSVCGNVGHAWLTVPSGTAQALAIAWASAPPTLLMLAVHGLPTLSRMLGTERSDRLLSAVVWGVTVGAFGWSAYGIFSFTASLGVPAPLAALAPAVIDLSVFGATRGLVLTSPIAARMKVGAPPARAASPQLSKPTAPTSATRPTPSTATTNAPTAPRPAPSNAPQGSADAPTPAPEVMALAEKIVGSRAVRQDVRTVARILTLAETEPRKAAIEKALGVHHSVVSKVLESAERERRSQLQAVS